jgi:hypothetical protein
MSCGCRPFSFEDKMIQVAIRVPTDLQNHPEVASLAEELSARFNSDWFDRKERTITCLHEGSHLVYKRMCGFEPRLFGPSIRYDEDTEILRQSDSAVESLPEEVLMTAEPMLIAKQYLAPMYVEEKLLAHRTFAEIWETAQIDLKNFTAWSVRRNRVKGDLPATLDVRQSVNKDLRSPALRRKLWDAAWEFEARAFGKPN